MSATIHEPVTTLEELRGIIAEPDEDVKRIEIPALDEHCRAFIARSPFVFLATSNAAGDCDVSPKGDAPGFVHVLDDRTLLVPDRKGNRRADSLRNILENPHAGLLFVIPGADWTLRVNGRAKIARDDSLRRQLELKGNVPDVAIVVDVEEAYMHCPRCVLRAGLWDTRSWMPKNEQPSWATVMRDHMKYDDVPLKLFEQALDAHNRDLY
jgi:PPOX class probable FMN-dependent enzyme